MRAEEAGRRAAQKLEIKRIVIVERTAAQERIARTGVPDPVLLFLAEAGIARVKGLRSLPDIEDGDALRQKMVERRLQPLARDGMARAQAHAEAVRMHAGIGAAAALAVGPLSEHALYGVLKGLLHARGVFLHLPAVKAGPVIGEGLSLIHI